MLMAPMPAASWPIMSLRSSAGSPKKRSPPCCWRVSRERWMAPIDCLLTLPYLVVSEPAVSAVHCSTVCRSLKSSSSRPCSSATLKTMFKTPSCVSLSCSRRAISTGPISVAVLADARQVAFDVGHEDRHAVGGKTLGDRLQGHGLAGPGGAGDQAVSVGVFQEEKLVGVAHTYEDRRIVAHAVSIGRTFDFSQSYGAIVGSGHDSSAPPAIRHR